MMAEAGRRLAFRVARPDPSEARRYVEIARQVARAARDVGARFWLFRVDRPDGLWIEFYEAADASTLNALLERAGDLGRLGKADALKRAALEEIVRCTEVPLGL